MLYKITIVLTIFHFVAYVKEIFQTTLFNFGILLIIIEMNSDIK